jgi:hypothetical protein
MAGGKLGGWERRRERVRRHRTQRAQLYPTLLDPAGQRQPGAAAQLQPDRPVPGISGSPGARGRRRREAEERRCADRAADRPRSAGRPVKSGTDGGMNTAFLSKYKPTLVQGTMARCEPTSSGCPGRRRPTPRRVRPSRAAEPDRTVVASAKRRAAISAWRGSSAPGSARPP